MPGSLVTFEPPITGSAFNDVSDQIIPRSIIGSPPSLVTFPPNVAVVIDTLADVGEEIFGAVGVLVVPVAEGIVAAV